MTTEIKFNLKGYDPFIDFIKAYAIICVLIGHTLPIVNIGYGLWAGMQVPLFILVQTFHFYKKEETRLSIGKLFRRVVLPFAVIGLVEFLVILLLGGGGNCRRLIISMFISGGGTDPVLTFPSFMCK